MGRARSRESDRPGNAIAEKVPVIRSVMHQQCHLACRSGSTQIGIMALPFDINQLSPRERIALAEELWDSLTEQDIELTPEQEAELIRRREQLDRDGPRGRPWRDVLGDKQQRGG